MSSLQKKVLVFLVIVFALWRIFLLPTVQEAFWAFCTVGALPGTDQTVSPEFVLKILIMAFPLALLIIFRKEFLAAVPWSHRTSLLSTQIAAQNEPVSVMQPTISRTNKKQKKQKSPIIIVLPIRPKTQRFKTLMRRARHYSVVAMWWAFRRSKQLMKLVKVGVSLLIKLSVTFWRWLKPRIRKFDHWIDITLHKSKRASIILAAVGEAQKSMSDLSHRALKRYSKY